MLRICVATGSVAVLGSEVKWLVLRAYLTWTGPAETLSLGQYKAVSAQGNRAGSLLIASGHRMTGRKNKMRGETNPGSGDLQGPHLSLFQFNWKLHVSALGCPGSMRTENSRHWSNGCLTFPLSKQLTFCLGEILRRFSFSVCAPAIPQSLGHFLFWTFPFVLKLMCSLVTPLGHRLPDLQQPQDQL